MNYKKILLDKKFLIGILLSTAICIIAVFGRLDSQNLMADIDISGIGLGGVGVDVSGDGFSFSTGAGTAVQPGCGGGNCLVAPGADEYSGIVASLTFREALIKWTNFFLGFLALIAMIILIYAGFMYVTAAGNDDQAGKAKKTIIWVVSGIIVILLAYALVNTLITTGPLGDDSLQ